MEGWDLLANDLWEVGRGGDERRLVSSSMGLKFYVHFFRDGGDRRKKNGSK